MKQLFPLVMSAIFAIAPFSLAACNNQRQLEACRILEIEDAEAEVDTGDVDLERGEVEMVCGDDIVDVTWSQFQNQLNLDPGRYKNNVRSFEDQVTCMKEESAENEVFCNKPGQSGNFVNLKFSYDD